ncbi:Alpha/Beta hydrolase protein [Aspergillus pseudoustus]|uniref:Alpha/Beta hydrolase protein n=1 Tax=Aspergillus pseudoustus TaxID=1810923 RepID=A0ABR4KIF9_9EURO
MALHASTLPLEPYGASLYYETQGSGPLLFLIPGGHGTSLLFTGLAAKLSGRFRVVTYDRRGFNRSSSLAAPAKDQALRTHTEDLAALISHLSHGEGAIIFGSSWAAIIAMSLVTTRPNLVAKAILHEPTLVALFPSAKHAQLRGVVEAILHAYRTKGTAPASRLLGPLVGSRSDREAFGRTPVYSELASLATDFFALYFQREFGECASFVPDLVVLRRERDKLLLVTGDDESAPEFPSFSVEELARRLGVTAATFPGGHMGYTYREAEFAAAIVQSVLGNGLARL